MWFELLVEGPLNRCCSIGFRYYSTEMEGCRMTLLTGHRRSREYCSFDTQCLCLIDNSDAKSIRCDEMAAD
jgi:hypothetical protein